MMEKNREMFELLYRLYGEQLFDEEFRNRICECFRGTPGISTEHLVLGVAIVFTKQEAVRY